MDFKLINQGFVFKLSKLLPFSFFNLSEAAETLMIPTFPPLPRGTEFEEVEMSSEMLAASLFLQMSLKRRPGPCRRRERAPCFDGNLLVDFGAFCKRPSLWMAILALDRRQLFLTLEGRHCYLHLPLYSKITSSISLFSKARAAAFIEHSQGECQLHRLSPSPPHCPD